MPFQYICTICRSPFTRHTQTKANLYCSHQCRHQALRAPTPALAALLGNTRWDRGCQRWNGAVIPGGYATVSRKPTGPLLVHRLVYELAYGPIPPNKFVCHTCDVRDCVSPEHLWLGTPKDNLEDAARKGRMNRGEARYNAKLTEAGVRSIRELAAHGASFRELARQFGVDRVAIAAVVRGDAWKHVH